MKTLEEYIYNHIILEKYGTNEEVELIVNDILVHLQNYQNYNSFPIKYSDKFIKEINININKSENISASYNVEKTDYINKVAFIELYYNIDTVLFSFKQSIQLQKLIRHEVTHCLEDFSRYNNGVKTLKDLWNIEYNEAIANLNNINNIFRFISQLNYFLNPQEQNAYLSNLTDDIKQIITKNNWDQSNIDYNKFIEQLKSIDTWNLYFSLGNLIYKIYNKELNSNQCKMIINQYKNGKKISDEKCIKEIYNKFIRFKNKFEQLVPKILFDNLPINKKYY